eukprot:6521392-Karenia_brevis.AAC.1
MDCALRKAQRRMLRMVLASGRRVEPNTRTSDTTSSDDSIVSDSTDDHRTTEDPEMDDQDTLEPWS